MVEKKILKDNIVQVKKKNDKVMTIKIVMGRKILKVINISLHDLAISQDASF